MRRWWVVAVAGVLLAYFVWGTEVFQRNVYPDTYWQERVESLAWSIALDRNMIQGMEVELEGIRARGDTQEDIEIAIFMRELKRQDIDRWREIVAFKQAEIESIKQWLAESRR